MNKSITQATQNDKQISKSIKRFFTRFHISSALKAANAYKRKGTPVTEIFQYMFLLIFSNRSMYMSLLTGKNTPDFAKDTVYRFMKMVQINWMRFTTILASRIINNAILPLDSEDRANVLIIDDSMFERNRSKKVELLAKVYDHAKHKYRFGFRMLTLGWSDGSTFLPVNSILLSTENKKNRINEAAEVDKRDSNRGVQDILILCSSVFFSIPTDTLLIVFLKYSQELRDFCGFDVVPDGSNYARLKQDFLSDLFHFSPPLSFLPQSSLLFHCKNQNNPCNLTTAYYSSAYPVPLQIVLYPFFPLYKK